MTKACKHKNQKLVHVVLCPAVLITECECGERFEYKNFSLVSPDGTTLIPYQEDGDTIFKVQS